MLKGPEVMWMALSKVKWVPVKEIPSTPADVSMQTNSACLSHRFE